jgi:hypothetical protein
MNPHGPHAGNRLRRRSAFVVPALAVVLLFGASTASAQGRSIGGHVGIASGLISRSEGKTTTMRKDCCTIVVPLGLIVRKNSSLPLDIGVAPAVDLDNNSVSWSFGLTTFRALGGGYAAALGLNIDVTDPAWGFVPALDKVLYQPSPGTAIIGDLLVPVMFNKNDNGVRYVSVGLAFHIGYAF